MTAQRASGLTQAAYCREHQLNAKYLTLWKRKLRVLVSDTLPNARPIESDHPTLIPVVLKNATSMVPSLSSQVARQEKPSAAANLVLKATLRNNVGVEFQLEAIDLAPVLLELAHLPC